MNVIIHDLNNEQFELLFPELNNNSHIIFDNGTIKSCIGCFGCWIKTPGKCVIKDGYDNIGELFSKADKVIVISKCFYGGFSPFVKNVLDRSIAYMLPFSELLIKKRIINSDMINRLNTVFIFTERILLNRKKKPRAV